jgi:hypothetical protein
MVVYDPLDPYQFLYDVDDGDYNFLPCHMMLRLKSTTSASTVITLSDWYHKKAREAGRFP